MKSAHLRRCFWLRLFFILALVVPAAAINDDRPVSIRENAETFIMDNGLVETTVSKQSGSLVSVKYLGKELLAGGRGSGVSAMWSHDATSPEMIRRITLDPATNGGARGELSIKGISSGRPMGNGPGGSFIADIEIRYALEKGVAGIYTYCIFDHPAEYPASSMGEARFVAFLQKDFDWMSVDQKRSRLYRLKDGELDLSKYQYTANQYENPAFGWIDTNSNVGFWLINASMEYMSGGPTKIDFLCHRDTRINGAPVFLNYWRSSHYGGSSVEVARGEKWAKLIGPILLYANNGENPAAIKQNALARAAVEKGKFPYAWVKASEFPLREQRGTVGGKLVLKDPLTTKSFTRLRIGLTAPDYAIVQNGTERIVDWQYDAKNYQFWTTGDRRGEFTIPNIRPGKYTLHAIADGVLCEFVKTDIAIEPGKRLALGDLEWKPVRRGRQLWEIGVPNRNGAEFLGGDRFYENDILKKYPVLFPNDVNYTVGKSDYRKDWFFVQLPRVEDPESAEANKMPESAQQSLTKALGVDAQSPAIIETLTNIGRSGKYAVGRPAAWTVNFSLSETLSNNAVLRLAICGTGAKELSIMVNGREAGGLKDLRIDGTPNRSGSSGLWYEHEIVLDKALFQKGNNTLKLVVPGGQVVNGIMYDYLRLEAL
jgi:rhamnogalacturonan endolyase